MATPELSSKKKVVRKKLLGKYVNARLIFLLLILFVTFLLISFVHSQQIFRQNAATTNQTTNGGKCAPVPFYCLILGGQKQCNTPDVCPTTVPVTPTANPLTPTLAAAPPSNNSNTTPVLKAAAKTVCTPASVPAKKLTIHFDFASSTILAADKAGLDALAVVLKQNPKMVVTINGYTDSVPYANGSGTNQALSDARAAAAKTYLVSKGASANQYVVKGFGATNFVAPNTNADGSDNPEGRAQNRRDEITSEIAQTCMATGTMYIMSNVTAHNNTGTGDYCLSSQGTPTAGGQVTINQCNSTDTNQQWKVDSSGTISIGNFCIDVAGGSTADGAKIVLNPCSSAKSQVWTPAVMTSGPANGQTALLNTSGKCLQDPNFTVANGTGQVLGTCAGTDNQSWILNPAIAGTQLACTKNIADNYYSGYLFPAPLGTTKMNVSGEWVVSTFSCASGDYGYSQWPGIGNYSYGELAQGGSYSICNGTTPDYNYPWTEAFPGPVIRAPISDVILEHDRMFTSVTMTSPSNFEIVLQNKTRGWTFKRTVNFNHPNWQPDYNGFIIEQEGNDAHALDPKKPIQGLPKFNDSVFDHLTFSLNGGAAQSLYHAPSLYCDDAEYQNGANIVLQDNTSPLRGDMFYITWLKNK